MIKPGDVISYLTMCHEEGVNLQRGMNYHLCNSISVILMSVREGAPYSDKVEEDGRILIYEGHDVPKRKDGPDPKTINQPMNNPSGSLTQNGQFFQSAINFKNNKIAPEIIKVYEKIKPGIWVFNGFFELIDSWLENDGKRDVFKFKMQITLSSNEEITNRDYDIDHTRLIPAEIKRIVWERDKGKCITCGATDNLHFDHIIPYSKGGSSLVADNIQLLCARHNLKKSDKIQ